MRVDGVPSMPHLDNQLVSTTAQAPVPCFKTSHTGPNCVLCRYGEFTCSLAGSLRDGLNGRGRRFDGAALIYAGRLLLQPLLALRIVKSKILVVGLDGRGHELFRLDAAAVLQTVPFPQGQGGCNVRHDTASHVDATVALNAFESRAAVALASPPRSQTECAWTP